MENDLKSRAVKVFFYNSQVTDPLTDRLLAIANKAGVPVVGVSETQPAGKSFSAWMLSELDATAKALSGPPS
jgi:zinc/manganese transport system substrate-binding protein